MEQALREKGLYEGQDMKEIISEIDADNVRQTIIYWEIQFLICVIDTGIITLVPSVQYHQFWSWLIHSKPVM